MADEAASGGSVNPEAGETENAGSEPTSPSLEELQRQLAEMEATQAELASRLQQQTDQMEPQLDSRLAVIEEQFRQNFEDRLRETAPASAAGRRGFDRLGGAADSGDVLLVNRVFREVSRCMGDEWRPVFDSLMAPLPPDVVAEARSSLQQHPPLIQGYRALLSWRECAGHEFDIRRLVDVLRSCAMDDVAEVAISLLEGRDSKEQKQTQPVQRRKSDIAVRSKTDILDNRRILLLAKKVGGDWEPLGKALGVPDDEIAEIKESADASSYQGAFKMLWTWRQSQTTGDDEATRQALRTALQQVDKAQLLEQIAGD